MPGITSNCLWLPSLNDQVFIYSWMNWGKQLSLWVWSMAQSCTMGDIVIHLNCSATIPLPIAQSRPTNLQSQGMQGSVNGVSIFYFYSETWNSSQRQVKPVKACAGCSTSSCICSQGSQILAFLKQLATGGQSKAFFFLYSDCYTMADVLRASLKKSVKVFRSTSFLKMSYHKKWVSSSTFTGCIQFFNDGLGNKVEYCRAIENSREDLC